MSAFYPVTVPQLRAALASVKRADYVSMISPEFQLFFRADQLRDVVAASRRRATSFDVVAVDFEECRLIARWGARGYLVLRSLPPDARGYMRRYAGGGWTYVHRDKMRIAMITIAAQ